MTTNKESPPVEVTLAMCVSFPEERHHPSHFCVEDVKTLYVHDEKNDDSFDIHFELHCEMEGYTGQIVHAKMTMIALKSLTTSPTDSHLYYHDQDGIDKNRKLLHELEKGLDEARGILQ